MFKSLSNLRKKTEKVHCFIFPVLINPGMVSGRKVLNDSVVEKNDPPAFGMHHAVIWYSNRHNILFKPQGFISGFSAPDDIIFIYECANTYHIKNEVGVIWNYTGLKKDLV